MIFFSAVDFGMPYSQEDLAKAVFMVKRENEAIYAAEKAYSVPYNTIKRNDSGTLGKGNRADQEQTSEEEERLASHIIDLGAKGFSQFIIRKH